MIPRHGGQGGNCPRPSRHPPSGCSKPPQGPGKCAGNFGPVLVKGINELMNKMQQPPAAGAFQGPGPGQGSEVLGPASRRCWSGDAALEEDPGDRGAAGAEGRPGTHQSAPQRGPALCWAVLAAPELLLVSAVIRPG